MDRPPTQLDILRSEGATRVIFQPGLTIDQWGEATFVLRQQWTQEQFRQTVLDMAT